MPSRLQYWLSIDLGLFWRSSASTIIGDSSPCCCMYSMRSYSSPYPNFGGNHTLGVSGKGSEGLKDLYVLCHDGNCRYGLRIKKVCLYPRGRRVKSPRRQNAWSWTNTMDFPGKEPSSISFTQLNVAMLSSYAKAAEASTTSGAFDDIPRVKVSVAPSSSGAQFSGPKPCATTNGSLMICTWIMTT